jgi:NAD(P)-dependent dehydrogenase (short-subunit alcohol dehydrogenase family)
MNRLAQKRILVTGGSRGIGAAIVRALHREGARVVAHYRSGQDEAEALAAEGGERLRIVHADLAADGAADDLWARASAAFGGIDVLVNNAGAWIASPPQDAQEWRDGWARNLTLNLTSAADLCRLALLDFAEAGGGSIINITSRSAHRGDDADHLAYGAAKAGLQALTKGIARGYGAQGVTAFAVSPGWVDTGLAAGNIDPDTLAGLPLGEVTPPEDVAELVAFLASGRSRHLTGATLDVTGADYVR